MNESRKIIFIYTILLLLSAGTAFLMRTDRFAAPLDGDISRYLILSQEGGFFHHSEFHHHQMIVPYIGLWDRVSFFLPDPIVRLEVLISISFILSSFFAFRFLWNVTGKALWSFPLTVFAIWTPANLHFLRVLEDNLVGLPFLLFALSSMVEKQNWHRLNLKDGITALSLAFALLLGINYMGFVGSIFALRAVMGISIHRSRISAFVQYAILVFGSFLGVIFLRDFFSGFSFFNTLAGLTRNPVEVYSFMLPELSFQGHLVYTAKSIKAAISGMNPIYRDSFSGPMILILGVSFAFSVLIALRSGVFRKDGYHESEKKKMDFAILTFTLTYTGIHLAGSLSFADPSILERHDWVQLSIALFFVSTFRFWTDLRPTMLWIPLVLLCVALVSTTNMLYSIEAKQSVFRDVREANKSQQVLILEDWQLTDGGSVSRSGGVCNSKPGYAAVQYSQIQSCVILSDRKMKECPRKCEMLVLNEKQKSTYLKSLTVDYYVRKDLLERYGVLPWKANCEAFMEEVAQCFSKRLLTKKTISAYVQLCNQNSELLYCLESYHGNCSMFGPCIQEKASGH